MTSKKCPCGSSLQMNECCGPLLEKRNQAASPEQLMRSRYTAFVQHDMDYLRQTTDPQVVLNFDFESNRKWALESEFLGLEIIKTSMDGNKGMVEFKADFKNLADGSIHNHHEISKFRKQSGVWYFRDGKVLSKV